VPATTSTRFEAIGTYIDVAVGGENLPSALLLELEQEIRLLDVTVSCFRPDSEVRKLHQRGLAASKRQQWHVVSPELFEILSSALWAAEVTDGLVDPTVGGDLARWQAYGSDVTIQGAGRGRVGLHSQRTPRYRSVFLDQARSAVAFVRGTLFDLHSISKALWADRTARILSSRYQVDLLVGFGGDVALWSPGGTRFAIAVPVSGSSVASPNDAPYAVEMSSGGIATSSVRWRRIETRGRSGTTKVREHIVDPRTRGNSTGRLATVSVVAPNAAVANVYSLAGIVSETHGRALLDTAGYPARMVSRDDSVEFLNGWPEPNLAELR
jgi:thiamine biosynthesis lipoprotein